MGEPPTVELFKKRNHARRDVLRAMMLLVPTFRYREYWLLSRILVLFANRYNGGGVYQHRRRDGCHPPAGRCVRKAGITDSALLPPIMRA